MTAQISCRCQSIQTIVPSAVSVFDLQSGNEYPEYHLFEAYLAYLEDNQSLAKEILKFSQSKEFTRDELEEAGIYLYLCTMVGLYRDKGQALQKVQNFFRQRSDSFQLL